MKAVRFIFCLSVVLFQKDIITKNINIAKNYKKIDCQFVPLYKSEIKRNINSQNTNLNTSLNWAGYVAATNINNPKINSVKEVKGSWSVPVLKSNINSSCVIWIGIDGFESSTIEQIGTSHQIINGRQVNFAWFAMHPNSSFQIVNFAINNNDLISATVKHIDNNQFKLKIINHTTRQFTIVPLRFTNLNNTLRKTAQWIVESNDENFARFDEIKFRNCCSVINNIKGNIGDWSNLAIKMILSSNVASNNDNLDINTLRAKPSLLSSSGKSFFVKWIHN